MMEITIAMMETLLESVEESFDSVADAVFIALMCHVMFLVLGQLINLITAITRRCQPQRLPQAQPRALVPGAAGPTIASTPQQPPQPPSQPQQEVQKHRSPKPPALYHGRPTQYWWWQKPIDLTMKQMIFETWHEMVMASSHAASTTTTTTTTEEEDVPSTAVIVVSFAAVDDSIASVEASFRVMAATASTVVESSAMAASSAQTIMAVASDEADEADEPTAAEHTDEEADEADEANGAAEPTPVDGGYDPPCAWGPWEESSAKLNADEGPWGMKMVLGPWGMPTEADEADDAAEPTAEQDETTEADEDQADEAAQPTPEADEAESIPDAAAAAPVPEQGNPDTDASQPRATPWSSTDIGVQCTVFPPPRSLKEEIRKCNVDKRPSLKFQCTNCHQAIGTNGKGVRCNGGYCPEACAKLLCDWCAFRCTYCTECNFAGCQAHQEQHVLNHKCPVRARPVVLVVVDPVTYNTPIYRR